MQSIQMNIETASWAAMLGGMKEISSIGSAHIPNSMDKARTAKYTTPLFVRSAL